MRFDEFPTFGEGFVLSNARAWNSLWASLCWHCTQLYDANTMCSACQVINTPFELAAAHGRWHDFGRNTAIMQESPPISKIIGTRHRIPEIQTYSIAMCAKPGLQQTTITSLNPNRNSHHPQAHPKRFTRRIIAHPPIYSSYALPFRPYADNSCFFRTLDLERCAMSQCYNLRFGPTGSIWYEGRCRHRRACDAESRMDSDALR